MAKKSSSTTWHQKHIPTKWGVAVLSFLLLATILLIPVLGQQQNGLSEAAGLSKSDQIVANKHISCSVSGHTGVCQAVSKGGSGVYIPGHCPGSSAIQCYISTPISCSTNIGRGTCRSTSTPANGGKFVAGYCPGSGNIQCLVPKSNLITNNTHQPGVNVASFLVCHNGKVFKKGGSVATNTTATLNAICASRPNSIYIDGKFYTCGNIPPIYKTVAGTAC